MANIQALSYFLQSLKKQKDEEQSIKKINLRDMSAKGTQSNNNNFQSKNTESHSYPPSNKVYNNPEYRKNYDHGSSKEFRCEICDIQCSCENALGQHLVGKRHATKIAEIEAKSKGKETSGDETGNSSVSLKSILSGSEYIKTTTRINNLCRYRCELCDVTFLDSSLLSHIKGKKHQENEKFVNMCIKDDYSEKKQPKDNPNTSKDRIPVDTDNNYLNEKNVEKEEYKSKYSIEKKPVELYPSIKKEKAEKSSYLTESKPHKNEIYLKENSGQNMRLTIERERIYSEQSERQFPFSREIEQLKKNLEEKTKELDLREENLIRRENAVEERERKLQKLEAKNTSSNAEEQSTKNSLLIKRLQEIVDSANTENKSSSTLTSAQQRYFTELTAQKREIVAAYSSISNKPLLTMEERLAKIKLKSALDDIEVAMNNVLMNSNDTTNNKTKGNVQETYLSPEINPTAKKSFKEPPQSPVLKTAKRQTKSATVQSPSNSSKEELVKQMEKKLLEAMNNGSLAPLAKMIAQSPMMKAVIKQMEKKEANAKTPTQSNKSLDEVNVNNRKRTISNTSNSTNNFKLKNPHMEIEPNNPHIKVNKNFPSKVSSTKSSVSAIKYPTHAFPHPKKSFPSYIGQPSEVPEHSEHFVPQAKRRTLLNTPHPETEAYAEEDSYYEEQNYVEEYRDDQYEEEWDQYDESSSAGLLPHPLPVTGVQTVKGQRRIAITKPDVGKYGHRPHPKLRHNMGLLPEPNSRRPLLEPPY